MHLKILLSQLFVSFALLMGVQVSHAAYPDKPIKLIVPFPPGGSTDIFARMLANQLTIQYKQPVIIENKPGASGQIAMDVLLSSPADGYTIYLGNIGSLAVNVSLYKNLNYDPRRDLAPISLIATVPNVLVVHPKSGVKTITELIAFAKQNPNQLTYSSGGNGSAAHTAMEYFKLQTGIHAVHIPYKGTSPAVTDVIGGQVDMIMSGVPPLLPFIQSGKVTALGVSTLKRIDALPQIPAIAETSLPSLKSFDVTQWYGLVVKSGTPKEIIQMLNLGVQHTFNNEVAIEQMKNAGAIVRVSTPAEFATFIRLEIDRWAKVVKAADIQPG
jgi:hypothetical protein